MQLNHTIVSCRDQQRSAAFLTGILGLPPATRFGHFLVVEADNGVSLDFAETSRDIESQHYAFLVSEDEFDAAFGRIREQDLPYWPIPAGPGAAPSTTVTAAAACTSRTPMATCWRSLPGPTVAGSPQAWRPLNSCGLPDTAGGTREPGNERGTSGCGIGAADRDDNRRGRWLRLDLLEVPAGRDLRRGRPCRKITAKRRLAVVRGQARLEPCPRFAAAGRNGAAADSIQERFSRTAGGAYLSNGCQHCDAIQGDWPLGRAVSDYAQSGPLDELPVLAAIEVADATRADAAARQNMSRRGYPLTWADMDDKEPA